MKQSNPIQGHETRGLILAVASVLCFTTTSLLLSHLNSTYGVDGWVAAAYRAVVGLIVITAMQSKTGKLQLKHIFSNRLLLARGLIGGATIPVYYTCIIELGPGRAGMIGGAYPLFAAVFALFLLQENLKRSYFAYIAIALIGLALVFVDNGIGNGKPLYDVLAIIGATAAGLCIVMVRHLCHSETTSTIFAAQCIFTLIITIAIAGDRLLMYNMQALGLTFLAAITVVGGQLAITESFRHINVAKGSTLQMLTPALTVLLSALLIGEHFSMLELIGGAAILIASYRIVISKQ
jgi:drug/metabolite transporter (DMT)-like permease